MADKIDDGGLAFPGSRNQQVGNVSDYGFSDDDSPTFAEVQHPGMSLRDWFAGQALNGIMAQSYKGPKDWTHMGHGWGEDVVNHLNANQNHVAKTVAEFSYAVADEMISARKAGA